ncbi:hypothetical protein BX600DRAFT_438738 [Xylariales sp. PMI_506]|nr:hypothetical protein BX600DRAFT_438738 [Xylariales sp. PMI_506]
MDVRSLDGGFIAARGSDGNSGDLDREPQANHPDSEMHVLVRQGSHVPGVVDIVAIHGLNGHFETTWMNESGVNWLRAMIPPEIPNSRVMSFSYKSMFQFGNSASDSIDFGTQLLECLRAERRSIQEQNRPIIFICHALGGFVFKQALARAFEFEEYAVLSARLHSVFFFGTPHRGSDTANSATLLGRTLRASLGTNMNSKLLKDLDTNSKILETTSTSFVEICGKLKICSFYETDKMEHVNAVVVDKESAIMGVRNEVVVPMPGDHRSICRFSDAKDVRFKPVITRLAAFAHAALVTGTPLSTTEELFLRSLATSSHEAHKNRNPDPVPGTCLWLLQHPKYKLFFDNPGASLLWLSADAGCGKSVLASFLVDYYQKSFKLSDCRVCYFFFKSDNTEQSKAEYALQSILYQIYSTQRELIKVGMDYLNGGNINNLKSLWAAFVASAQDPNAQKTICIIDGLDECEPESRKLLLLLIRESFVGQARKEPLLSEPTIQLKMMVASRPDNAFKVAFEKPQTTSTTTSEKAGEQDKDLSISTIRLRGEDETDSISNDITKVIKFAIADFIDQGLPMELLTDAQTEMIDRADRTFLWVSLILELLKEKVEAGASRREVDDILASRDIDVIYNKLLSQNSANLKARKLLSIVLAATQPLTVEQLSIALAVAPEHDSYSVSQWQAEDGLQTFDDVEYDMVYPFENHIKSLCGHFVRIIRNKVYLVHNTARDFLLDPKWMNKRRTGMSGGTSTYGYNSVRGRNIDREADCPVAVSPTRSFQYSFSQIQCRALLLELCIVYLYLLGRKSKGTTLGAASEKAGEFLSYAASMWTTQLHQLWHLDKFVDLRKPGDYLNLCHPRFPGFYSWVSAYCYPDSFRQFEGSEDQRHDQYVEFFRLSYIRVLRGGEGGSHSAGSRGDEEESNHGGWSAKDLAWRKAFKSDASYSSNPGSLSNHNFPLRTNEAGMVVLDFSQVNSPRNFSSK